MSDQARQGTPTTLDAEVALDLPGDVLRALDAWIAQGPAPHLTRSEAAVSILAEQLAARSDASRLPSP